jgi:hypothetical protein
VATFVIGQPISTAEPFITVDAGLPVGRHRFQLEVVTSDRRVSKPDFAEVDVIRRIPIGDVVITGTVTPILPTDRTIITRPGGGG